MQSATRCSIRVAKISSWCLDIMIWAACTALMYWCVCLCSSICVYVSLCFITSVAYSARNSLAVSQYANGRMTAPFWQSDDPEHRPPNFYHLWHLWQQLLTLLYTIIVFICAKCSHLPYTDHIHIRKFVDKISCLNRFHIFPFEKSKWKALQDADVGAMGREKSNFLPFEEIFSHDRDKSAPRPPQIIQRGEQQEGILFWKGKYHYFAIPFQWFWICWYSLWCIE